MKSTLWIIPCNLEKYDAISAFSELKCVEWKQSTNVEINDEVYIYLSGKYAYIKYKCKAIAVNLSDDELIIDDSKFTIDSANYGNYGRYMRLELLEEFDSYLLTYKKLKENGLKGNIQGPLRAKDKLLNFLTNVNYENNDLLDIEEQYERYLHSDEYKEDKNIINDVLEEQKKFLKRFDYENLKKMEIDDYVEGKENKDSFCYWIEVKLHYLGSIKGSYVKSKFAIHYSKEKKDYLFDENNKKWGNNSNEVFSNVKKAILDLYNCAKNDDIIGLENNPLSNMFKSKIYYVYFSDKTLPIYSTEHLVFFVKALNLQEEETNLTPFICRELLLKFKRNSKIFKNISNLEFMYFLYSSYGFEKETNEIKKMSSEISSKSINFYECLDLSTREIKHKKIKGKTDYVLLNERKSAVGQTGEEIVLQFEKKNNSKYRNEIFQVSNKDDSLGYDIKSFDKDGNEIHIEVKTKSSNSVENIDFFITPNEYKKLIECDNHFIYYVCGIKTNNIKIVKITKECMKNVELVPVAYKISAKSILSQVK